MLNRERLKLSDQHRGIKDMRRLPEAVVIVDVDREITALLEAIKLEIPVIAMVDTNCDPRIVTYPIPANDDSVRAIQIIISALVDAILEVRDEKASKEEDISVVIKKDETIVAKSEEVGKDTTEDDTEVKVVKISESDRKKDKPVHTDKKPEKIEAKEKVVVANAVEKKTIVKKTASKTKPKAAAKKPAKKVIAKLKITSKKSSTDKTAKKTTAKKVTKESEKK